MKNLFSCICFGFASMWILSSCAAQDDGGGDYQTSCLNMSTTEHDANCSDEKFWTKVGNTVTISATQNAPFEKLFLTYTGNTVEGTKNIVAPDGLVYITGTDTFRLHQTSKLTVYFFDNDRISGQMVTKISKDSVVKDFEVDFKQLDLQ